MNKDQIIEIAVKAALDWRAEQDRKQKKSRHDRRLRNTRLLLRNYFLLKDHCNKSVYSLQTIPAENAIDVLDSIEQLDSTAYIDSIKKSVTKTFIIIKHIDTMLEIYEIYCQRSKREEDRRRYRVLYGYYFDGLEMSKIVEQENIDERTYYRDMRDACDKLGALIFGLDSIQEVGT